MIQTHSFLLYQFILLFEIFLPPWHHKLLDTTRDFCKNSKKTNYLQFCSIFCVALCVEALLNWLSRMLWQRHWLLWFTLDTPYSIGLYNNNIYSTSILPPSQPALHSLKYVHKVFLNSTVLGIMKNLMWLHSFFMCYRKNNCLTVSCQETMANWENAGIKAADFHCYFVLFLTDILMVISLDLLLEGR